MRRRSVHFLMVALAVVVVTAVAPFAIVSSLPRYAAAQTPPSPTPPRPPAPTPPVIPTPSIPQHSFKGPSMDIPKEARDAIPDKDFIDNFCLTTRWQMELFYRIMDIWGPGFAQLRDIATPIGVQVDVPDIAALKVQGKAKVDAVCAATTVEAAQAAVGDVLSFGSSTQDSFLAVGKQLETKFRDAGNNLQAKIEGQVNQFVEQEKARVQAKISAQVAALVAQKRTDIQAQIDALVKQEVAEITKNVTNYANSVVDKEVAPFKKLDSLLTDLGAKSTNARSTDTPEGKQLKQQAIAKRKQIVGRVLDINIARAKVQLEAARADLDLAKQKDPSAKNADEILAELAQDRKVLEQKIDAALASDVPGPDAEIQFSAAIAEFTAKWNGLAQLADSQRPNAISIRDLAVPQLTAARVQLLAGAQSITQLLSQAAGKSDAQSQAITAQAAQLGALKDKLNALAGRIDQALATLGKVTADSPVKPLTDLLDAIQKDGDALQKDIQASKNIDSKRESIIIQAEDEVAASVSKPGTSWDSTEEVTPSWRAGWTGNGDWYLSRGGDRLTYKFDIQNPGTFYVWVRDWDDGKHPAGSGAIDMDFSWGTGTAQIKNVPENTVRNSQHQWHQAGQVTLGAPGKTGLSMTVTKSATTSKAAVLDAFFLTTDPKESPPANPPVVKKVVVLDTILIQAEDEATASVSKPGTNWDSVKEVKPSWRAGWTGSGDWYLSRGGDKLTYKFNIKSPGVYFVWVRDWDDGKHPVGSGAINMDFSWNGGAAQIKNVPENSVHDSQHQWHQVGQVTLGAAGQTGATGQTGLVGQTGPSGGVVGIPVGGSPSTGPVGLVMTVTKVETTSKAAVLDAFFLTTDAAVKP